MASQEQGRRTREAILRRAAGVASMEGLEGLSIGRLAADLGVSKSGLFGHFGSKEELQLATIRAAKRIYRDAIVEPALTTPPGLERLWKLCGNWLVYSEQRVFPGGCFFFTVLAEFSGRSGPVRDALAAADVEWHELVARTAEDARQLGEITHVTDTAQLAFEVVAFMEAANSAATLHDDGAAYRRARAAIAARLRSAATAAPDALDSMLSLEPDLKEAKG